MRCVSWLRVSLAAVAASIVLATPIHASPVEGRDYVKLYFPPEAKAKMDALVANVKAAMGARLDALAWMSPATKAEAHAKLAGFGLKIGHPDTYRDYSALVVKNGVAYAAESLERTRPE